MKLRRHPSERNLGRGSATPRSPLSNLNSLSRLESTINKRRVTTGSRSSPNSSPKAKVENWRTPSSNKKRSWRKCTGTSVVSQRVKDIHPDIQRYKEPVPFDVSSLTPVPLDTKPSRNPLVYGLTNTSFQDLLAEFRDYRKQLIDSASVEARVINVEEIEAPNWKMTFKTPPSRVFGSSNVPRRLFETVSSPLSRGSSDGISKKRNNWFTSTPKSNSDGHVEYHELDSPVFAIG